MANNFKHPGKVMSFVAPAGGVVSGTAYLIGGLLVVALETASAGDKFDGDCEGVWTLPKAAGAWTEGELLYWDNAAKNVTTTSTSNYRIGCAGEGGAASGDATGPVRLNGQAVPTGA